ncbi:MAG TPA: hypothetical protein VLF68_01625 [Candidatus Saccharimonadales bacterium]|nr:hypothetical protein [Candidatus Saccharimonadales bacterium]
MTKIKLLVGSYWLAVVALFLYSFTQVDLSLTLARASIFQSVEKWFQYIGYFNRPLSTVLFLIILALLFAFYIKFLLLAGKNKLSKKVFWIVVLVTSGILVFSYNAFSYDLFNYIFDAKIITHYHQNPYLHKALDFPGDPMLSFMHWTHRVYPYGPSWLAITVPLSFIGMQFFLPTLMLFKLMIVGSFIGSVYFIGKILDKISPKNSVFGMVFFALNPLVLIESTVSAHNDIVMFFLALAALYFLITKRHAISGIFLLLSIGIKFATGFLLPVFAYIWYFQKKGKTINWDKVFLGAVALMTLAVFAASYRTTFQPWYILYILPFVALVPKKFIVIPSVILSFGVLLEYVPYLYLGNYDAPVPAMLFWITFGTILISIATAGVWYAKLRIAKR